MDELLALMDDNPPTNEHDASSKKKDSEAGMDDLLTLMDQNPPRSDQALPSSTSTPHLKSRMVSPSLDDNVSQSSKSLKTSSSRTTAKPVDISVDDRLGIRMLQRKMSSIDLLDFISTNPYHSPASISSMSLAGLNRFLIDPPSVVDKATVYGKTSICTVGIVFSNSGTRISAKGSAFCIVKIGNFNSGPCVSVFLFGEAYGVFCRTCVPGKVVALYLPKLLPTRDSSSSDSGGDTTVSFAVYDKRQFFLVANARDYGTCKATVRVKQVNGQWTSGGKCKNYIDKRQCEYCHSHRMQQQQKSTSNATRLGINPQKSMTFVQKLKNEFRPANNENVIPTKSAMPSNRFLRPDAMATISNGQPVPMHMKKTKQQMLDTNRGRTSIKGLVMKNSGEINRNKHSKVHTAQTQNSNQRIKKRGIVGLGVGKSNLPIDTRQHKKKKSQRLINTCGGGFDGSVMIPQPSRLFQSRTAKPIERCSVDAVTTEVVRPVNDILQKQLDVAMKMKNRTYGGNNGNSSKKMSSSSHYSKDDSAAKSLFGSLGNIDQEKILNAKSRFASEADAEEYATRRRNVVELEKLEASKDKSNKRKITKVGEKNMLSKEWLCETCGTRCKIRPNACIKAGHRVKLDRQLQNIATKTQKRTQLHDKSVENGGLSLGAGIEWSRQWSRFS